MTFPTHQSNRLRRDYTLMEALAVLVVVGILSAVVVSRGVGPGPALATETALLRTNLRYAQTRAMSDTASSWSVALTGASYTLQRNGIPATVPWSGSTSPVHVLPAAVAITGGTGTLAYDSWGNPGPNDWTITLSQGGRAATVTVTGVTGFIP